ncbi:MAG: hypothetical protein HRF40_08170 [Nitrososphaera sp.]
MPFMYIIVGYAPDSSEFERMSTKKLAILFGLAFFGAFMAIQMIQGFPLFQLFTRQTTTSEVPVKFKQGDVCVIEPPDEQPKEIRGCTYNEGDILIVSYYEGSTYVESHRLK